MTDRLAPNGRDDHDGRNSSGPSDPRLDDPDIAEFLDGVDVMRDGAVRAAKALVVIERKRKHRLFRASSIGHFGELIGCLTAPEARMLRDLGVGMDKSPALRDEVEDGMAIGRAALFGEVAQNEALLLHPPDLEPDEPAPSREDAMKRWIEETRGKTHKETRALVDKAKAQLRSGPEPVTPFLLYKNETQRRDFEKARDVASRKAGRRLTPSEADAAFVTHYLASFDRDRVKPGTRRVPDTGSGPRSRYVPAEVKRAILTKQAGKCAVPFCDNEIWLEFSHDEPYAEGGCQEERNLRGLCPSCHDKRDRGDLVIVGPPGHERYLDRHGREINAADSVRKRRRKSRGKPRPPPA